jgi:hypothetical protein
MEYVYAMEYTYWIAIGFISVFCGIYVGDKGY